MARGRRISNFECGQIQARYLNGKSMLAISHQGTSPICFIVETLKLIKLLIKELKSIKYDLECIYYDVIYFQQDIVPAHASDATQNWLDMHGSTLLGWLANLSDLNSVENEFGIIAYR